MPLVVHFLNVGRGDCTIAEFPSGRVGIIDIDNLKVIDSDTKAEMLAEYRESQEYVLAKAFGNQDTRLLEAEYLRKQADKTTDPLAYYDIHIGANRDCFRFLVTHPDMDHMTGLYRLHKQDRRKSIINFWHTGNHDFNLADTTNKEWEDCPYDKRDWDTYKDLRAGNGGAKSLQKYQKDTGDYWTDDGLELWAPTQELETTAVEKGESNILSMIIKLTYKGKSIVLGGDATRDDTWPTIYSGLDMKGISVLKASHHGRKTGFYWPAVKEMSPWLTITSVGEKEHDATDQYRRYSEHTVSLRRCGDLKITIDDNGELWYPRSIEEHWKGKIQAQAAGA